MTYTIRDIPALSFTFAERYLGGRSWRPIANNTEIGAVTVRNTPTGSWGGYTLRLHSTNILTVTGPEDDPGRFLFVDTGGWNSVTTFQRLNQCLPSAVWSYDSEGIFRGHGYYVAVGATRGVSHIRGHDYDTGRSWETPLQRVCVIDTHTGRPTYGSLVGDASVNLFTTDRPNKGN